jgi:hypothetical protein
MTKILGGDSHSIFFTEKRQEFLVSSFFPIFLMIPTLRILSVDSIVVTPHTCDKDHDRFLFKKQYLQIKKTCFRANNLEILMQTEMKNKRFVTSENP